MHLRLVLNLLHFLLDLAALYAWCIASNFYEIHRLLSALKNYYCYYGYSSYYGWNKTIFVEITKLIEILTTNNDFPRCVDGWM